MPPDINFELGASAEALIAEFRRVTQLAQNAAASINFQQPFDNAATAATRAARSFQAADLSLSNMARTAANANEQFVRQQAQLRQVEATIRRIRELPIINERQFQTLRELEGIQLRLQRNLAAGILRPETFAQAQTAMARFRAELEGVARAQKQVALVSKDIQTLSSARVGLDPRLTQTLSQFRDTISQIGPISTTVFESLRRGTAASIQTLKQAEVQSLAMVNAEKQYAAAIAKREAAQSVANTKAIRDMDRLAKLQVQLAQLPLTPAVAGVQAQIGQAQLRGGQVKPEEMAAMTAQVNRLKETLKSTIPVVKEYDTSFDKAFSQFVRYAKITALFTASFAALRAVMAGVDHIVKLDSAMRNISATLDNNAEKARVLPAAYDLIQKGMTQFGLSTEDAGKLTLELNRTLDSNVQLMQGAFVPALALTTTGEVNQSEAVRTLIGIYNTFGLSLVGATTPMQAFQVITDKIIRASDLSVGSISTFSTALTYVGARAAASNVSLDETLALLSIIQDSLGKAGQSGTGLARVFEGLTINARQLAETFGVAFDPNKAVRPMELLRGFVAKLRVEFTALNGISEETAKKVQAIVGTEQGTRQLELFMRQFEKLDTRLRGIGDSSGRGARQVEENNKKISTSFDIMTNQVLVSIEKITGAIAKAFGGEATPGQYGAIAQTLRDIGDLFESAGNTVDRVATKFNQLAREIGAVGTAIITLGGILPTLPEPPEWLMRALRMTGSVMAGAAIGTVVAGPVGTGAGAGAGLASALAMEAIENRRKERTEVEALTKSLQALQEQRTGERQPAVNQADIAANVARATEANIAARQKQIAALEAESNREVQKKNAELDLIQRIGIAEADYAQSSSEYAAARAQFAAQSNLGLKDQEAALTKLTQLEGKRANDLTELNALRARLDKEAIDSANKLVVTADKQADAIRKLQAELRAGLVSEDPSLRAIATANTEYEQKIAQLINDTNEAFARENEALVSRIVSVNLTKAQQSIYDALVTPYRDATQQAIIELDKLIQATDTALANINLSAAARGELAATPDRAVDLKLGIPEIRNNIRELEATFGLFGEEAREATFAASIGFTSMKDAIVAANVAAEYLGANGLTALVRGFTRLREMELSEMLIKTASDLAIAQRQLSIAFSETGADPAVVAANTVAWTLFKESINEVATSSE